MRAGPLPVGPAPPRLLAPQTLGSWFPGELKLQGWVQGGMGFNGPCTPARSPRLSSPGVCWALRPEGELRTGTGGAEGRAGGELPLAPTLGPAWGLLTQRVWGSKQIVNVRLPRGRVTVRVPSLPSGPQDSSSLRGSAGRLCHGCGPRTDTRVWPSPSSAGTTPDAGPCRSPDPLLPSVSWKNCFNIHGSRTSEEGQTDRGARAGGAESRGGPLLGKQRLLTRPLEEYLPQTLM